MDPYSFLDLGADLMLTTVYAALPNPPVSLAAPLTAARAWVRGDRVDRISRLPDAALHEVVARLPAKDAARTTVLSSRWRHAWHHAPLVLVDAHLLPGAAAWDGRRPGLEESRAVTATVSHILAAHPGPFRAVHLTCNYMDAHRAELARWLQLLTAKGVQDLAFVNRPWPCDLRLPGELFRCAFLTRLYLGVWRFPDTGALPRGTAFPNLRELGLCFNVMEDRDLSFLLARSPALETLSVNSSQSD
ncbi:hypothetical protein ACP70R_022443 [Stipagrostis hirtigluma subsp. patula]